ncbi:hypothetical protein L7F22_025479 [Adiantum nelumboides]|nr:hypothetical protein [Adiantum nelumboides]
MFILAVFILLVLNAKEIRGGDDNGVYNPCVTLGRLKMKDGISLGVGMQLPQGARTSVFRPVLEQIGQFELTNSTYVELRRNFAGDASLIIFAGRNPTVISKPRYFLYSDGRVSELTLDIHFEEGKLSHLIWKEDDCAACYSKNQLCRDDLFSFLYRPDLTADQELPLVLGEMDSLIEQRWSVFTVPLAKGGLDIIDPVDESRARLG